jgi:hypothetical protein
MLGREFIKALAVAATVWPLAAQAQTYASRPVVMVVPYAAGGTFDVMGRILATRMSEVLGQPVIVENTTGRQGHHRREPRHQRRARSPSSRWRSRCATIFTPGHCCSDQCASSAGGAGTHS